MGTVAANFVPTRAFACLLANNGLGGSMGRVAAAGVNATAESSSSCCKRWSWPLQPKLSTKVWVVPDVVLCGSGQVMTSAEDAPTVVNAR